MFPRDPDKVMTIQISLLLFCLEALLLAGLLHYVTTRRLDAQFRFSLPLSLLVAGAWMLLSLSSFLYVTPASLLGLGVSGTWLWLRYTILLFVILMLTGRYLVFLPWGVAAAYAAISSAIWFLGMCFGKALGVVKWRELSRIIRSELVEGQPCTACPSSGEEALWIMLGE